VAQLRNLELREATKAKVHAQKKPTKTFKRYLAFKCPVGGWYLIGHDDAGMLAQIVIDYTKDERGVKEWFIEEEYPYELGII
jgi:hypothetical protein